MPRSLGGRQVLFIVFLVFAVDSWTKLWVHGNLPLISAQAYQYPYGGIGLFQNFLGIECSISHAVNTGAAWGILSDYQWLLLVFRVLVCIGLLIHLLRQEKGSKLLFPLALIVTGALGNIVDTFLYGHVVDMIHFKFWGYDYPVFNIADSAIFIGIALLLLAGNQQSTQEEPPQ